jgi:phosphohistidine phosphatase
MKRLLLLRHAKSSRDDPGREDFDRPLAKRGRAAAPEIGRFLRQAGLAPDLVLCSAARRTRETAELTLAELDRKIPVRFEDGLYLAPPEQMLRFVRAAAAEVGTLLIVGHNPGTAQLAQMLAADGDKAALRRLREKYPTGGLAVLEADVAGWQAFDRARLTRFVVPADLA